MCCACLCDLFGSVQTIATACGLQEKDLFEEQVGKDATFGNLQGQRLVCGNAQPSIAAILIMTHFHVRRAMFPGPAVGHRQLEICQRCPYAAEQKTAGIIAWLAARFPLYFAPPEDPDAAGVGEGSGM